MNQSETIAGLAGALALFQGQVHGATKNATNPHLKNKYADLASIWEAVREPLTANGLSVVQLPAAGENGSLRLRTRLMHASGEWLESEIQMQLGKADPQGYGSALSYARRYGLVAMLGVVQEDDDGEGAMKRERPKQEAAAKAPEGITDAQMKKIGAEMGRVGWDGAKGKAFLAEKFNGKESRKDLTKDEAGAFIEHLASLPAAKTVEV